MSDKYRIRNQSNPHFLTMTTVGWVDVFTRNSQRFAIIDSLSYCIKHKGLTIYAYVIMSNHLHLICSVRTDLSAFLRDFKSFTSKRILSKIMDERESRKRWMLQVFSDACSHLNRNQHYKVWQNGNHAMEIPTAKFLFQKVEYIHNNPVRAMIVEKPEDYLFSSARNYADLDALLDIEVLGHKPLIFNW